MEEILSLNLFVMLNENYKNEIKNIEISKIFISIIRCNLDAYIYIYAVIFLSPVEPTLWQE